MTVLAFPGRTKRCNDRALALVRASIVADLTESKSLKNGESRALRALEVAVRLYIACAWLFAILIGAIAFVGLCAACVALPAYGVGLLIGYLTR